jgi:hypothetical protein
VDARELGLQVAFDRFDDSFDVAGATLRPGSDSRRDKIDGRQD